jgi:hypothetical protein
MLSCCLITARCNGNYTYRKLHKEWREHISETDRVMDRKYTRNASWKCAWDSESICQKLNKVNRKSIVRAS